ncbi:hypothetical protein L7F22_008320 [Adiantum nelumboides]|nr:hypothetical protein [Adiantum nelumboides]
MLLAQEQEVEVEEAMERKSEPSVGKGGKYELLKTLAAERAGIEQLKMMGKQGRAYLFTDVSGVEMGPKVDRPLLTGLHMVSDIKCSNCHELLGWKYVKAYQESQKYKEGKYILEKAKIMRENW